jgi:nucleotide-binding universal stress UspA family protein
MLQKILLCVDGSDEALSAALLAADLACRHNAHVELINVLDPIIAAGPSSFVPQEFVLSLAKCCWK